MSEPSETPAAEARRRLLRRRSPRGRSARRRRAGCARGCRATRCCGAPGEWALWLWRWASGGAFAYRSFERPGHDQRIDARPPTSIPSAAPEAEPAVPKPDQRRKAGPWSFDEPPRSLRAGRPSGIALRWEHVRNAANVWGMVGLRSLCDPGDRDRAGRSLRRRECPRIVRGQADAALRCRAPGSVPVALQMEGALISTDGQEPPQLQRLAIAINRHGTVSTIGLPVCPVRSIEATTTRAGAGRLPQALIGSGRFTAHIAIPTQAPFPADGKMLAFNSVLHGRRVILAHIYGTDPVPTSRVLVMTYQHPGPGAFGTILSMRMPNSGRQLGLCDRLQADPAPPLHLPGQAAELHQRQLPRPEGAQRRAVHRRQGHLLPGGRPPRSPASSMGPAR